MNRAAYGDRSAARNRSGGHMRAKALITGGAILGAAALAVILIFRFIDAERDRALLNWQTRLGIVADSRTAAVETWLAGEREEITGIAGNTSVRIYLAQILSARERGGEAGAEAEFLRNLLVASAARAGYDLEPRGPDLPANVERVGRAGIAVLDPDGQVVVQTRGMPRLDARFRAFATSAEAAATRVYGLHRSAAGEIAIGFAAPIQREQAAPGGDGVIGHVVALKPVAGQLFPLLRQPGATAETAEAVLIRRRGGLIEYLSPLMDGADALSRMSPDTPGLAAAAMVRTPGGFGIHRDYRGREVLAVSRAVEGTPWVLLYKIDRAEALAPTDARLERLLIMLLMGVGLAAASAIGLWRHGASRRAAEAARLAEDAARRLEAQRDFLRVVTDNQPNAIYIVDDGDSLRFVNAPGAVRLGIDQEGVAGQSLTSVMGAATALRYERLNREARDAAEPVGDLHREDVGGAERILQSKHVPFRGTDDLATGVMIVEEDVTQAIQARERRERNLRQIVDALVSAVDQRDPHAARHSVRVGAVGEAMAREMDLEERLVETARFAGELMNVGKILVPPDLLTKPDALSPAERKQVQDAIEQSADLLSGIEFDGPVADTLRQVREQWNGTGPRGLQGEEIIVTARIVAAANAFVAMTSPRAHRDRMSVDDAVNRLLGEAGETFDRRAVAALIGYLENRGGRAAHTAGADAS